MTQQRIVDRGDFRRYATTIPNIYDELDLSPYAFRLLVHYKCAAAAGGGEVDESVRATADACNMSKASVGKYRDALEGGGLIEVIETPAEEPTKVRVVDMWQENFARYAPGAEGEPEVDKNGRELTDHQKWFDLLAKVCGYDYEVITDKEKARIGRAAGKLSGAGKYSREQVQRWYSEGGWWYENDWRGQRGEYPTPEQVRETIGRAARSDRRAPSEPRLSGKASQA